MVALETDALRSIYYRYNEVDDLIGFRIYVDEYNFSDYYYTCWFCYTNKVLLRIIFIKEYIVKKVKFKVENKYDKFLFKILENIDTSNFQWNVFNGEDLVKEFTIFLWRIFILISSFEFNSEKALFSLF